MLMKIQVRPVQHLLDEHRMGFVMFYDPLADCDGISVTANPAGFTTLSRVLNSLRADSEETGKLVAAANADGQIRVVSVGSRKLFLVPSTRDLKEIARLTDDLLTLANREHIRALEMTHFNFMLGRSLPRDIEVALASIKRGPEVEYPAVVVFDIDARFLKPLVSMLDQRSGDCESLGPKDDTVNPSSAGNQERT